MTRFVLLALTTAALGCGRSPGAGVSSSHRTAQAPAPAPRAAAEAPPPSAAGSTAPSTGGAAPAAKPARRPSAAKHVWQVPTGRGAGRGAQPSRTVAANPIEPGCPDCTGPDGGSLAPYTGHPHAKLDENTLADVRRSIDETSGLIDDGLKILEAHTDAPDKALEALRAYEKESLRRIDAVFRRARDVKVRLHAAGYDQDIPHEVQPYFESKMSAIHKRVAKMRDAYQRHGEVLEAFGRLFPRDPR